MLFTRAWLSGLRTSQAGDPKTGIIATGLVTGGKTGRALTHVATDQRPWALPHSLSRNGRNARITDSNRLRSISGSPMIPIDR